VAKPKFTIITVRHIWKMYPVNLHSPETTQHSTTIHTDARPRLITLQCSYSSSKTTLLSLLPLSAFTLWGRNENEVVLFFSGVHGNWWRLLDWSSGLT